MVGGGNSGRLKRITPSRFESLDLNFLGIRIVGGAPVVGAGGGNNRTR